MAKRASPAPIAPITTAGVRYEAPHWSFQNACKTNGGCIEARDARSNQELLWYVQVYKVRYLPFLERDVQDVFVASISVEEDDLVVVDEKGRKHNIDLTTRKVRNRTIKRHAAQEHDESMEADVCAAGTATFPADIRITRDVPYGSDKQQRFDVYSPMAAKGAPVIFMVQVGAWFMGTRRGVLGSKQGAPTGCPEGSLLSRLITGYCRRPTP